MADTSQTDSGAIERRDDVAVDQVKAGEAAWKFWRREMQLSETAEKDWREEADKVIERYRGEKAFKNERYRLLYSNTRTMAPALFNSRPIPDIRRRFNDRDEDARAVAQALERTVSCQAEKSDFEGVMKEVVRHLMLPGRGVARVRYEPHFDGDDNLVNESVGFEVVPWKDFRHGAAKRWSDVPWVAFRIFPKREDLEKLSREHGPRVPLDARAGGSGIDEAEGQPPADSFKRAEVWQIWDAERHEIVYWAPRYRQAPIAVIKDELKLEGFFPTPEPLLAIRTPDDLRPVTEWSQYALLADELETITKRLRKLVAAAKFRGVVAKELKDAFSEFFKLDDGKFAAAEDALAFTQEGGLEHGVWTMPLAELVATIKQLYEAREQTKQVIFEVTGLADVLRGSTNPNETLGAQQLKAQWGSLRLQDAQNEVQRYCRDLYRLAVEIIATRFDPRSIMLASGVNLKPEQVKLMQRDTLREYRIEIETDSTIRADLGRQQENIGQFVQGLGTLMQALEPAVASGLMQPDEAADLLTGFARSFKLGRQAEEALERMGDRLKAAATQGGGGGKPDPEMVKVQAEGMRQQQELQFKQQVMQMDMAMQEKQLELKERELAFKEREAQMRMQEMDMQHRLTMTELGAKEQAANNAHQRDLEKLSASQSVGVPPAGARQ